GNWDTRLQHLGDYWTAPGCSWTSATIKARLREIIRPAGPPVSERARDVRRAGSRPPSASPPMSPKSSGRAIDTPGVRVSRVSAWESEDACATLSSNKPSPHANGGREAGD
ncbi:MAG: hypothetical protein MZV70_15045, partial [Desulfobacterales bacterium]|nr:hypothetical protein [Desulfobacterales bacterium]